MVKIINVNLKGRTDHSYDIVIGRNLPLAEEIRRTGLSRYYALITDNNVWRIYHRKITQKLQNAGIAFQPVVFPAGERHKSLRTMEKILDQMLRLGFNRKSAVIAFGGGVTGDIAGFAAGTFMRGIPFIQIPTTLLAQVDSSIGGKVGVDLRNGKNSAGLFCQPRKVLIDTEFLETLPLDEMKNGLFEIIKHGIIADEKYFAYIQRNIDKAHQCDHHILEALIIRSCEIKADVVMKDEREENLRRTLNFGHTIGHAIEGATGYKVRHGLAVGFGMVKESEIAFKLGHLSEKDFLKIKELAGKNGASGFHWTARTLLPYIASDKKNFLEADIMKLAVPLVLPNRIGETIIRKFSLPELVALM
jgi:3-dehydroquinate synthase